MCFAQRHLKRLLAFSTISHMGVMVMGFGLGSHGGLAGAAVYALGHGLIKASLFLCVGLLLHRFKTVDEIPLRGRGKRLPMLGLMITLGGLGLAGLPPFGTFLGESSMEEAAGKLGYSWLSWIFAASAILTGGAVLRAAGRIFLGLGPLEEEIPGVGGETSEKPETIGPHKRLPVSMVASAAALLLLGWVMAAWPELRHKAGAQAERMRDTMGLAARVLDGAMLAPPALEPPEPVGASAMRGVLVTLGAALLAALTLLRKSLPEAVRRPVAQLVDSGLHPLRELHSGHVGDYVAWLTVGVVGVGGFCALLLR
jgi:multicomponent Na+:H+ antiporter subunit D